MIAGEFYARQRARREEKTDLEKHIEKRQKQKTETKEDIKQLKKIIRALPNY